MEKEYALFNLEEAKEHLQSISQLIVSLEKDPNNEEDIQALFRSAHSVKGMAASMGYNDVAELSHKMEDMMDFFRKGEKVFSADAADLILEGLDALELMVKAKLRGINIGEVGITHIHRVGGRSSLKPFTVAVETIFYMMYLKLKEKLYRANVVRTF